MGAGLHWVAFQDFHRAGAESGGAVAVYLGFVHIRGPAEPEPEATWFLESIGHHLRMAGTPAGVDDVPGREGIHASVYAAARVVEDVATNVASSGSAFEGFEDEGDVLSADHAGGVAGVDDAAYVVGGLVGVVVGSRVGSLVDIDDSDRRPGPCCSWDVGAFVVE